MARFLPTMRVVLTVPHAVDGRCAPMHCFDPLAAPMAELLAAAFRRRGHEARVILSAQNRFVLDDNRVTGRRARTPLWQQLGAALDARAVDYLVDVHSYPDGELGRDSRLPVVVSVLHMPEATNHVPLARAFGRSYLALHASTHNAILMAARRANVPANLVEFNEAMAEPARAETAERFVGAVLDSHSRHEP